MTEVVALALTFADMRAQGHTLLRWWQQRLAQGFLSLPLTAKLLEQFPVVPPAASADLTPPGIPIF